MSKRILVVDDEDINLTVAKSMLEKNYEVVTVNSGTAALEYLEENTPDLILLDSNMPVMNGFQVMENISKRPEWHKIPVIILTADVNSEMEDKCFELGAIDYIEKPFYHNSLFKRVERTLELEELRNALESGSTSAEEDKGRSTSGRKAELQRFSELLLQYREKKGVFEVGYKDFEKVFELASRFTKRNDQKLQLVLFTLLPIEDDFKDEMVREEVMTLLSESIHSTLRRVDISVRFSGTQYLVALIDTESQYISVVTDRILQSFYVLYRGKDFVIDYDIAKIR